MEQAKKSIITELNLQENMFLDMYVFTIAFENGDIGKMYKKKKDIYEKVGQEMEYTIDHKNKVKAVFKGQSKFNDNNTKTTVNYVNNDVTSQDIIRHAQAMNLAEQRYVFDKINHTEIEKVTKEIYFKLKNFNGYKENEVEQKVEVDNDMPF